MNADWSILHEHAIALGQSTLLAGGNLSGAFVGVTTSGVAQLVFSRTRVNSFFMREHLDWIKLYRAALHETDPAKQPARIEEAKMR